MPSQLQENQEKHRDLLDNSNDLIQSITPQGDFRYVNRAWLKTLEYDISEVTRLKVLDIIHPDCRQTCVEILEKLLNGEEIHRVELDFVSKTGRKIPVEGSVNCKFEAGKPVLTRGFFRDVSARREAEERLRRSEMKYRGLIEQASDGIFISDDKGNFIEVNSQGCQMLGYDYNDLLRLNWKDIFADKDSAGKSFKPKGSPHGKILRAERILKRRDGESLPVEISARVIDENQMQVIVRDITERRRAEVELSQSEKRYRSIVENARDIIYTHDLEGNYTSVNKAGERITGYTREETLKMNIQQTLTPACWQTAREMIARKLDSETETVYDLDLIAKDGRVITFEVNTKLVYENGQPVGVQGIARDITERRRSEDMLLFQKTLLESLSEASLDGILVVSSDDQIISYNSRFVEMWELSEELLENRADALVLNSVQKKVLDPENFLSTVKYLYRHPDEVHQSEIALKDNRTFERYSAPVKSAAGKYYGRVWFFRDITERKQLEEKFRQSQKMEAIGQLAGGIAHDFNNLLTAITGYSDLSLRALPVGSRVRANVEEIRKASERAALLTRQLLAFSRKQVLQPMIFNPNTVIKEMEKMMGRLIGENIQFNLKLDPNLGSVSADPGQFEQVLINLLVNARDAMPTGGKLIVETTNAHFDTKYVKSHIAGKPGRFVLLTVSDTGCGMDEKIKSRIFDPFFTTKEKGKGTGLGLSTVYGIVKQSGGFIWVYSELGIGSTFKVYLPMIESDEAAEVMETERNEQFRRGSETILLVEDEELLRPLTQSILEDQGYKVLVAADAAEAIALSEKWKGEIHLLLTDVVLPQQNGRELAESMSQLRPGISIVYMSGYTDNAIVHHGVLDTDANFIQKPFSPDVLLSVIRKVLDSSP